MSLKTYIYYYIPSFFAFPDIPPPSTTFAPKSGKVFLRIFKELFYKKFLEWVSGQSPDRKYKSPTADTRRGAKALY